MLPGVGIFGSDPITKILIQLLRHFEFEIHAIWTNHYEIESASFFSLDENLNKETKCLPKLITTSIDNVLLNKNVNLVFVCCQPNLHSQISTKALGIGKNVICLFPTCKDIDGIIQMINSARYYPSLMSSINYGGLRFLSEFKLIKQFMHMIGEIKLCNIVINCQNIALIRQDNSDRNKNLTSNTSNSSSSKTVKMMKNQQRQASLSSLIDSIAYVAASTSSSSINWRTDRDLGAGVLNRFGAAMISLILHLFDDKKVTKVFGSLRTFIDELDGGTTNDSTSNSQIPLRPNERTSSTSYNYRKADLSLSPKPNLKSNRSNKTCIRKITADDHCTFQMCLEPNSIMVNVTINSLAQCKYSQEIVLCGNEGVLVWKNSKLILRSNSSNSKINDFILKQKQQSSATNSNGSGLNTQIDKNNNNTTSTNFSDPSSSSSSNNHNDFSSDPVNLEVELVSKDPIDSSVENFLNSYKNVEKKHPELPLIYIKGLYYYLADVKREFLEKINNEKNFNNSSNSSDSINSNSNKTKSSSLNSIENFEHTRIVQTIIKYINLSSETNRWVTVNY